jgi:thiol-disulfide isomerase/thioredoxin
MDEAPRRSIAPYLLVLAALAVAWLAFLRFFGPKGPAPDLAPPALRAPNGTFEADFRWSLVDLDGRPVDFAQLRGKPVFLNLWATWCGPCVEELPSIDRLATNPRLKEVAFLAVSTEPLETIRAFARQKRLAVPVYQSPGDPPPIFQTDGIPATFLIARDGRIAAAQIGSTQWDDPSVVEFLEKLAAQPAP